MKTFTRILAAMLVLVMALGMVGMTAMAADTITGTAGSITITKYEYNGTQGGVANGSTNVTIPADAKVLAGVEFSLYKVADEAQMKAYYNGTGDSELTVASFVSGTSGAYTVKDITGNTVSAATETGTTGTNGVVTFSSLPLGMYVIIETKAPDKVVTPCEPFLVSVPMTINNEWVYNINVYPKNSTSEGTVTLKKVDAAGSALADVTFKLEKKDGTSWTPVGQNMVTGSNGTVQWSELAHGDYRVTEISAPDVAYIVDPRPIEFTVNNNNTIVCNDTRADLTVGGNNTAGLNLTLVNEKPTIDKEIVAGENTASVGEDVSYSITVSVPKNIADLTTYTVTDAPINLTAKTATIDYYVDNNKYTMTGATVTPDTTTGGFSIAFTPANLAAIAGKNLVIKYDATINASAAVPGTAPNTATLEYTNKIGTTNTNKISDDEVTHLYTTTITKKLDNENGAEAAGVKFQLFADEGLRTALKFSLANGVYTLDPNGAETTLVTNANGQIVIKGLGKHSYYLVETETKEGYNLLSGAVELDMEEIANNTYELTKTIVNKKGFNLPATGGLGTLMFIVLGGVLMAGGICLVSTTKKRSF